MTSRSDNTGAVLVYEDGTPPAEAKTHRFFIGGVEVLHAFEESGDVVVKAKSEAHVREIVDAFQFLDQAEFGGEH